MLASATKTLCKDVREEEEEGMQEKVEHELEGQQEQGRQTVEEAVSGPERMKYQEGLHNVFRKPHIEQQEENEPIRGEQDEETNADEADLYFVDETREAKVKIFLYPECSPFVQNASLAPIRGRFSTEQLIPYTLLRSRYAVELCCYFPFPSVPHLFFRHLTRDPNQADFFLVTLEQKKTKKSGSSLCSSEEVASILMRLLHL